MNYYFGLILLLLVAFKANGFPQSLSDVAVAIKETDNHYYQNGASDLIPYDNPQDKDNAREEYEGFGSKAYTLYDGLHKKTSDAFQPKAVVDTIKSESEIYGNTGDNLKPLSNIIVSTMSVVSDIVNRILDAPGNILTSLTTNLNSGLNKIGERLVGLA